VGEGKGLAVLGLGGGKTDVQKFYFFENGRNSASIKLFLSGGLIAIA
jgi:hypothetical protein